MREMLARWGLVESPPVQTVAAAEPRTSPVPSSVLTTPLGQPWHRRKLTRNWQTLVRLAESPLPSRAITLIRDKVVSLEYVLKPREGLEGEDFADEIELVGRILESPNIEDEDFAALVGPIVEDLLVFDLACWEYVERPRFIEDNDVLSLVRVPGYTIERARDWDGDPKRPRWAQVLPGGIGKRLPLLDRDVEVFIQRRRSGMPYGISPMEVVVGLMDAWLGLATYQQAVASNAYPAFLLDLGEDASQDQVDQFRAYWETILTGQARPGIIGGGKNPQSIQTKAQGDEGLYLKFEELLRRIIAFVFKLKPQDFGVERDVNRSQGEVSQSASIEEAVKPYARTLAGRINNRVIPRIASLSGNASVAEIRFEYPNIDPWDEKEQQEILDARMEHDLLTLADGRAEIGREPYGDERDDMTWSQLKASLGFGSLATPRAAKSKKKDSALTSTR